MKTIEITPPVVKTAIITLYGETSLICHKWSTKAKQEMLDKQMKKATKVKEAKDPHANYLASLYEMESGGYGFPATAFKAAAVRAGTIHGLKMTETRQMFYIHADEGDLVRIDGAPTPREDMVRLNGKTADIRHRGEFIDWRVNLHVRYVEGFITEAQILNLFGVAGMAVGVGEWRPERNGTHGMWSMYSPV